MNQFFMFTVITDSSFEPFSGWFCIDQSCFVAFHVFFSVKFEFLFQDDFFILRVMLVRYHKSHDVESLE